MFKQIVKDLTLDKDYPQRAITIDMYTRVLEGRLYDHFRYPFYMEYDAAGNYIQLRDRAPSVTYNICRLVVDDSVSLTFGSDHFPEIISEDEEIEKFSSDLIEETNLNSKMIEAATYGSVGSIVIFMRILNGKVFWEVSTTQYLTPIYDPADPESLLKIIKKFKVKGKALQELGYIIPNQQSERMFWFMKEWNRTSELTYRPWLVSEKKHNPEVDKERSTDHKLEFVPAVWIKNLPKPDSIDGVCTFEQGIDTNIEIDYQLSQGGRGLKYSSDPTVVLKLDDSMSFMDNNSVGTAQNQIYLPDGATAQIQGFPLGTAQRKVVRSANNALTVGKDENVELLEISGKAAQAICDYVRQLREFGIEAMHGNRANADKVNAAQSGKAQREMNQALIWLADRLRVSYGENGLLKLIKMAINATQKGYEIILGETRYKNILLNKKISLKWPHWYSATPDDRVKISQAIKNLTDNGVLSKETATKNISDDYGIKNVHAEQQLIAQDQQEIIDQEPQVKENINV